MSFHWILGLALLLIAPIATMYSGLMRKKGLPFGQKGGYHTDLSISSEQAWAYAQSLCGKSYLLFGAVMAAISVFVMFSVPGDNALNVWIFTGMLLLMQVLFVILLISSVESALRAHFGPKQAN